MSRYYTGSLHNLKLEKENEGWFDFGSNCYAMQSFEHRGRRISIGWISDFYDEHAAYENGAYGSMTIPRELHIRNGKLYMIPVQEIKALKGKILYEGRRENIALHRIDGNAYRAEVTFSGNTFFTILLGKDEEKSISLVNDKDGLRIVTKGVNSENICFKADVDEVKNVEIYIDRRTAEIYVNEGEAVGTKVFYSSCPDGCFELCTESQENIERIEVALMQSIWK